MFETLARSLIIALVTLVFCASGAVAKHVDRQGDRPGMVVPSRVVAKRVNRLPRTAPLVRPARPGGGPAPAARFSRDGACAPDCLPPGRLLDFSASGGPGPPGNLPRGSPPQVVVMPIPGSGALLLFALGGLGVLSRRSFSLSRR